MPRVNDLSLELESLKLSAMFGRKTNPREVCRLWLRTPSPKSPRTDTGGEIGSHIPLRDCEQWRGQRGEFRWSEEEYAGLTALKCESWSTHERTVVNFSIDCLHAS